MCFSQRFALLGFAEGLANQDKTEAPPTKQQNVG
jgi:hypothetical protein